MPLHFSFIHPRFGTKAKPLSDSYRERSVYYWWFQYLRRNADYKATCDGHGVGPCAALYKDFGDVHAVEFKTWWDAKGPFLFAQPDTPSIQIVERGQQSSDGQVRQSLLLDVPLDLPIAHLVKRFKEILAKHHSGKKGHRHHESSQARYPTGGKIDIGFIKTALQVWDVRQAEPDKPLWEIANDFKLGSRLNLLKPDEVNKRGDPAVIDKKNILAATASRHIRRAKEMIDATAKGNFPHLT